MISTDSSSIALLEKTQALMEVERSLTATLERVEAWLPRNTLKSSRAFEKRVRPIPSNMEEVQQVLAVARSYSPRTSAPAGWNPAAPVMGFSTPNPLPHQLRGGALAALQLERARQDERSQKRKRQEEEAEQAKAKKMAEVQESKSNKPAGINEPGAPNQPAVGSGQKPQSQTVRRASRPAPPVLQTTMNLSDSSSSEEESDDE
jgi:hypothetical protein